MIMYLRVIAKIAYSLRWLNPQLVRPARRLAPRFLFSHLALGQCMKPLGVKTTPQATNSREKGMASIEAISTLVIFLVFISYGVGHFGIVHTSILHSIAARTYAFETFRHRTDLTYFRDSSSANHYLNHGFRVHGVLSESDVNSTPRFSATTRPLSIGRTPARVNAENTDYHNREVQRVVFGRRNENVEVSPVWIKVMYGMCLNSNCGGG